MLGRVLSIDNGGSWLRIKQQSAGDLRCPVSRSEHALIHSLGPQAKNLTQNFPPCRACSGFRDRLVVQASAAGIRATARLGYIRAPKTQSGVVLVMSSSTASTWQDSC